MKVHKILIPLIIALTFVLIQGCAVDDRALDGSKEKNPQLAVNDEVITPDPEDEIIDLNEETFEIKLNSKQRICIDFTYYI